MSVRPSGWTAGCPCKPCAQSTGRNFEDNLMKFGRRYFYDTRTKPIEIGYDRFIISPTPIQMSPRNTVFTLKNALILGIF